MPRDRFQTVKDVGEVAILLAMATAIGLFGILLGQPLIVSFIAVGLIAGPSAVDVVQSDAQIDLLSEFGLAVLLFLVGIKFDVKLIRSPGQVALTTGSGRSSTLGSSATRSVCRWGWAMSPASTWRWR